MVGLITNDIRKLLLFVDVQCVHSQLHCTLTNVFSWGSSEFNSLVVWWSDLWALYWSVNRTRSDNVGGGDTLQTGKQASTTSNFTVSTHIATTLLSTSCLSIWGFNYSNPDSTKIYSCSLETVVNHQQWKSSETTELNTFFVQSS